MHAPFLRLKVNAISESLQAKFEGKGQGQSNFRKTREKKL
jgi:hypothetical protein